VAQRGRVACVGDPSLDLRRAIVRSIFLSSESTGSAFVLREQVAGAMSWHGGNAIVSVSELLRRELISDLADDLLRVGGREVTWGEDALTNVFGVVIHFLERILPVYNTVGRWLAETSCGEQGVVDAFATDNFLHRAVSAERVIAVIGGSISIQELGVRLALEA
jgi:hypothetical protein